jgi:hypothetical protein
MREIICRVAISRGGGERNGWSYPIAVPREGEAIEVTIENSGERVSGIVESLRPGDGLYDWFVVARQAEGENA